MISALMRWWRRQQRATDVKLLWLPLIAETADRDHAKAAFRLHMAIDPAYDDLDEREKQTFLDQLP